MAVASFPRTEQPSRIDKSASGFCLTPFLSSLENLHGHPSRAGTLGTERNQYPLLSGLFRGRRNRSGKDGRGGLPVR